MISNFTQKSHPFCCTGIGGSKVIFRPKNCNQVSIWHSVGVDTTVPITMKSGTVIIIFLTVSDFDSQKYFRWETTMIVRLSEGHDSHDNHGHISCHFYNCPVFFNPLYTTFGQVIYDWHNFDGHFWNQTGKLPQKQETQLDHPKLELRSTKTQLN